MLKENRETSNQTIYRIVQKILIVMKAFFFFVCLFKFSFPYDFYFPILIRWCSDQQLVIEILSSATSLRIFEL